MCLKRESHSEREKEEREICKQIQMLWMRETFSNIELNYERERERGREKEGERDLELNDKYM